MRRSSERILTTHVGRLIRPGALLQFIGAKQRRSPTTSGLPGLA